MTLKTRAALQTEKDNTFTTNANQDITALKHRGFLLNLLDSFWSKSDEAYVNANIYSITKPYAVGDLATVSGRLLVCNATTSGAYDSRAWDDVKSLQTTSASLVHATQAANLDLASSEATTILVDAGGGAIATINNGINGRTYRIIPESGLSLVFAPVDVANSIINGAGELAVNAALIGGFTLVGRASLEGSDFIDIRCYNFGGIEYWGLENYKILV
jgi:hypothetical protein